MVLVLDKQIVADHIDDMVVGISMLFMAYFVFNVKLLLHWNSFRGMSQNSFVFILLRNIPKKTSVKIP